MWVWRSYLGPSGSLFWRPSWLRRQKRVSLLKLQVATWFALATFIHQPVIMLPMIKVPFSYGLLAAIGIIILLKTPPLLPPSSFPPRVPGATQSIMTEVTPLMVLRFPRVCCPKANVTGLHDWSRTQHCLVVLSLADGLQDCNRLIWHKPRLNLQHQASPCLEQRFRAALKAQSSDDVWAAWVQLAFGLDSSPSPYKLASSRVIKGKPKDLKYLLRLMKAQRRILANAHRQGWTDTDFTRL